MIRTASAALIALLFAAPAWADGGRDDEDDKPPVIVCTDSCPTVEGYLSATREQCSETECKRAAGIAHKCRRSVSRSRARAALLLCKGEGIECRAEVKEEREADRTALDLRRRIDERLCRRACE